MEIVQILKEEFDVYADSHPNKNFYQTSKYGMLMDRHNFDDYYLALKDDAGNIKAATLILINKVLLGYKWGYCPRGFLIDFNDYELLETFTKLLKAFLNRRNFMYIKIDPYVIYNYRDKKGEITESTGNDKIIDNLKKLGYEHSGFNLNFENLKPRFNAIVNTTEDDNTFEKYNKELRNKIRKAQRSGIEVMKGTNDSVKEFYSLISKNKKRKLNYYLDMMELMGKDGTFEIYFAFLNTAKYIEISQILFEKVESENNIINQELEDNLNSNNKSSIIKRKIGSDDTLNKCKQNIIKATNLYKVYPEGIIIGANAIIKYKNEVIFLIDGYKDDFKNYCSNHYLKHVLIEKFKEEGYTRFNLNGISGDFKNDNNPYAGLNKFKLAFNTQVEEYIGEFSLTINKRKYTAFNKINPIRKWLNEPLIKIKPRPKKEKKKKIDLNKILKRK